MRNGCFFEVLNDPSDFFCALFKRCNCEGFVGRILSLDTIMFKLLVRLCPVTLLLLLLLALAY